LGINSLRLVRKKKKRDAHELASRFYYSPEAAALLFRLLGEERGEEGEERRAF
jgi:hypothetical protein